MWFAIRLSSISDICNVTTSFRVPNRWYSRSDRLLKSTSCSSAVCCGLLLCCCVVVFFICLVVFL